MTSDRLAHASTGTGDPILLVHAGGLDRRMWDGTTDELSGHGLVIRPDLREAGETPPGSAPYAHHADLGVLLDEIGRGPAHVVGVSFGAGVAAELALERPDLVRSLVLVSPGGSLIGDPVGRSATSGARRPTRSSEATSTARSS